MWEGRQVCKAIEVADVCAADQIHGAPDQCYKCQSCPPPEDGGIQTVPDTSGFRCVLPVADKCACNEKYSEDMATCQPCNDGEYEDGDLMIRDPENKHHCVKKQCALSQYFMVSDTCVSCGTCPEGQEPSKDRKFC